MSIRCDRIKNRNRMGEGRKKLIIKIKCREGEVEEKKEEKKGGRIERRNKFSIDTGFPIVIIPHILLRLFLDTL